MADLQGQVDALREETGAGRGELDGINAELMSLLKQRGELESANATLRLALETLDEESELAKSTIEELCLKKDTLKKELRAARDKVPPRLPIVN